MGTVIARLPRSWQVVPSPDAADYAVWREDLLSRPDADAILGWDLERLDAALQVDDRHWIAVIPETGRPRIAAVGWIRYAPGDALDISGARTAAERGNAGEGRLLLDQSILESTHRGRHMLVVHRLLAAEGTAGSDPRLFEWVGGVAIDRRTGLGIDLEISTSDMSAFENLAGDAEQVLTHLDVRKAIA